MADNDPLDLDRLRASLRSHPMVVANPTIDVAEVGGRIVVTGTVPNHERRRAVGEAAAELVADRPIDLRVRIEHPLDTREFDREV